MVVSGSVEASVKAVVAAVVEAIVPVIVIISDIFGGAAIIGLSIAFAIAAGMSSTDSTKVTFEAPDVTVVVLVAAFRRFVSAMWGCVGPLGACDLTGKSSCGWLVSG